MSSETGASSSISITDTEENIEAVSAAAGNAAADTKEEPKACRNRMRMLAERKRRNRVKNYFGELRALMPHVNDKCDKETLVGHATDYIQSLKQKKAILEKRKQAMLEKRKQVSEGTASSSAPPPLTAQGMEPVTMFTAVPDGCNDVPPPPPLQPLALPAAVPMSADVVPQPLQQPGLQVGFQTWTWPNLVLSVSNDNAYINVSTPRHLGMGNMVTVLSVLNNRGIDVVTMEVDSDAARSVLNIYAHVNRMGGENPSSEEVYKLAMSEILLLLNTN